MTAHRVFADREDLPDLSFGLARLKPMPTVMVPRAQRVGWPTRCGKLLFLQLPRARRETNLLICAPLCGEGDWDLFNPSFTDPRCGAAASGLNLSLVGP